MVGERTLEWPLFILLSLSFACRIFSDAIWYAEFEYVFSFSPKVRQKNDTEERLKVNFGHLSRFSSFCAEFGLLCELVS